MGYFSPHSSVEQAEALPSSSLLYPLFGALLILAVFFSFALADDQPKGVTSADGQRSFASCICCTRYHWSGRIPSALEKQGPGEILVRKMGISPEACRAKGGTPCGGDCGE